MARITVEDCLTKVSNRFELVLLAAKRARQLARGGQSFVNWGSDKATVVALREIADGHVDQNFVQREPEDHNVVKAMEAGAESEVAPVRAAEPDLSADAFGLMSASPRASVEPTLGVAMPQDAQPTLGVPLPVDAEPTLSIVLPINKENDSNNEES